jgi:hypothetical protein
VERLLKSTAALLPSHLGVVTSILFGGNPENTQRRLTETSEPFDELQTCFGDLVSNLHYS